ncbi:capsular biosynthesis protein [Cohaesibacter sp. CAU 1516]|uniref:capsule biosynthesis protein n=1 Tax=Cohaesibacter sp. CAU 1516 TaxID=2576038 RepID=UPI001AED210E|nr:capsular biosynthesis protein [Cohaesibacter sp. CAU 1516]
MLQTPKAEKSRVFLFLQGHPSFFARNVAAQLEQDGHKALRINFCLGDSLVWLGRPAVTYRGRFRDWEAYVRRFIISHGVTDIVYYADRKPYHQVAARVAQEFKIATYCYEFGYLRPDWITLERGGMSAFSHFPNNPDQIAQIATHCDEPDQELKYPYTKPREILYEVSYNLLSYFSFFLNPFYRADRYYNPLVEYVSGIPGLFFEKKRHRVARELVTRLARNGNSFFIFSLQLQSDYQLRSNAPFSHQREAIRTAIESFARRAESKTHLVFKAHPLDNGWERWGAYIKKKAKELGIEDQIHFIIGGNLTFMLKFAKGCVLINSTVGMHAIRLGCPVKVLGHAVYDIPRVTHSGPLDSFWDNPQKPDAALVDDLVKVMANTIQVKGNFFTTKGQRAAVPAFAARLANGDVNCKGAFLPLPPRLSTLNAHEPPLHWQTEPTVGRAAPRPAEEEAAADMDAASAPTY